MSFLLEVGTYGVSAPSALVLVVFFLGNLLGPKSHSESWRHAAILLVSGATGIGLLVWSIRVGHFQGQWLAETALAAGAAAAFGILMLAGLLLLTRVHWQ